MEQTTETKETKPRKSRKKDQAAEGETPTRGRCSQCGYINCECGKESPANNADPDVIDETLKIDLNGLSGDDFAKDPPFMVDEFPDALDPQAIADVAYMSGYFGGRSPAQLLIAILTGQELGLTPMKSLFDLELTPGRVTWKAAGQPAQAAGDAIELTNAAGRHVAAEPDGRGGFKVVDKSGKPATIPAGETVVVDFPQPISTSGKAKADELDLNEFLNPPTPATRDPFDLPISATVDALTQADDPELADALASDPFAVGPDGLIPAAAAWDGQERRKEQEPAFMYDSERRSTPWNYENANKGPSLNPPANTTPSPADVPNVDSSPESGEARPQSAVSNEAGPTGDDPVADFAAADAESGVTLDDNAQDDVTGPRDDESDALAWRAAITDIMKKAGHPAEVIEVRLHAFDDSEQPERRKMFEAAQDYILGKVADWTVKILTEITARGFEELKAFALFAAVPSESSLWTWEDCELATKAINTLPEKKPAA